MDYRVYSTDHKVYIDIQGSCVGRLCNVSADFYDNDQTRVIPNCTFEKFQEEAKTRGYIVDQSLKPKMFVGGCYDYR